MRASIIIVNFNTCNLLKRCLDSVADEMTDSEVIVVDNGSRDGSVEMLRKLRITPCLPAGRNYELRIIENKENVGFAKAVNQAIKIANGETIFLLNSDTEVCRNSLTRILEFEVQVKPAIIGSKMLNPDGSVQGSCFFFPTVKRAILEFWLRKGKFFSKYAPEGEAPVEVEVVSGGAMLISREIIEKIGYLDEKYFMYFEDLDYCRRVRKSGLKIFYLPSAKVIHVHGASGKNMVSEPNQWRRMIPSAKKYYGGLKYYIISFILWTGQKLNKTQ